MSARVLFTLHGEQRMEELLRDEARKSPQLSWDAIVDSLNTMPLPDEGAGAATAAGEEPVRHTRSSVH